MKSALTVLTLSLALAQAISCSKSAAPNADTITLGTHAGYPPYESIDVNGKVQGFDIDVANAIAQKLKKTLVIKDLGFDALVLSLKQGKIDFIMAGMSITPARQKEITMIPYQGEQVRSFVLVASGTDMNHLTGNIAVQTGTWMEVYLRKQPGVTPKALEGTSEILMDVIHGKSDAGFLEPHVAKTVLPKHPNLKSIELPLKEADWVLGNGIGIKKENTALAAQIQKAVADLKANGELAKLEAKWLKGKVP